MGSLIDPGEVARRIMAEGAKPVVHTWRYDWQCPTCQRYGNFPVELTGQGRDERSGKPTPQQDDEEFRRRLYNAHRDATSGLCPSRTFAHGRIWRWEHGQDGRRMVLLLRKGEKPEDVKEYRWPPQGL